MSDKQEPVTSPAGKRGNTTNKKKQRQPVRKKRQKEDNPPIAEPQHSPRRQRLSGSGKIIAGKRAGAESTVKGVSKPAAQTKPETTAAATRRGSTNRKTKPEKDVLPPEVKPEPSSPDSDLGDINPRIKAIAIPHTEPEPALAEAEAIFAEPEPVVSEPILPAIPQRLERRRVPGKILAWVLLVVLTGNSFLFWRDVSDTHLYLYALDATSGQTLAQQDLGGGYQGDTTITNPAYTTSSFVFGVQIGRSASGSKQQLFSLAGNDASWQVQSQFSLPLEHGTLALIPGKRVIVAHAGGLQVMTPDGQALWHMQGDEPTLGTHPFQSAFDSSTLYTVKSASNGVVASYDLQSGAVHWAQKLDDTLEYAAPFLLYGNRLYVAADHTLYALDKADGALLWKADRPARTLLMFTKEQPLLLAAGPQGLTALNASTGAITWSYNGQPTNTQASTNETLMPAQFYQASIGSTNHVMYATGIVWDTQQVREQLWLFAVDASTGNVHWSERIGSDFTSADAGRIYAPSVDTTHGLVILQQAQDDGKHIIAAYNAGDGSHRWSVLLDGVTASAPGLIQVSNTVLISLDTQSSRTAALHSWSPMRVLLIALVGLSVLWLLLLWMLPFQLWVKGLRTTLHNLPRYRFYPVELSLRLWRFSHKIFAIVLLTIFVLGGALLYAQLASPQTYLFQVAASSGSTQWQITIKTPVQLALTDSEGSIVKKSAGEAVHQLTAFGPGGASQWTSFASEGDFSLPVASTHPGTVLVALSGHTSPPYRFAPNDPAYGHPLDSLYTLYLLDRQTGQIIWQNIIISPEGQHDTTVLGTDAKFIYVASRATNSLPPGIGPVVQLIAVDKTSGNIAWRIFGTHEPDTAPTDYGSLLLGGRIIIWQVSNTIIALDIMLGQIQWRRYIPENLPQASLHEEEQMAVTAGVILVTRSDAYHALDLSTANERWVVANPGNDTAQITAGVVAIHNIFLLYGGRALQAIDPTDQHIIWSQQQLVSIQSLKISDDGTLV